MRFLVDAPLPPSLATWIVARSHTADHVMHSGMMSATDREIAEFVERTGTVLVTKDADFIILRHPDRFAPIWLRLGNATRRVLATWLTARWPYLERRLKSGERLIELR